MKIAIGLLFICMFLIIGVTSKDYVAVQIPEDNVQYLANSLQRKHHLNYADAQNCISELGHFYTGIKYGVLHSLLVHPSALVEAAWEAHIIHTSMYYNFTVATFGTFIHYKPIDRKQGQLHVYHRLQEFGINDLNETIWLMELPQEHEYLLSTERWNTFFAQSDTLSSFNRKPNKFLQKFIEGYQQVSNDAHVLDIGMGEGRNALWLAQKGYKVTGFDSSVEGIKIAKDQAKQLNLTTLQTYVTTIEAFEFGLDRWDMILSMYFGIDNDTDYIRKLEQSLKCNGLFIVEGFHWDGLYGEDPLPLGVTFKTNQISTLFPRFTTLLYEEPVDYSDFGNLLTKLVRYIGRKQC